MNAHIQLMLMLYAGIVSMKAHPRNEEPIDFVECMKIAEQAYLVFDRRAREIFPPQEVN